MKEASQVILLLILLPDMFALSESTMAANKVRTEDCGIVNQLHGLTRTIPAGQTDKPKPYCLKTYEDGPGEKDYVSNGVGVKFKSSRASMDTISSTGKITAKKLSATMTSVFSRLTRDPSNSN